MLRPGSETKILDAGYSDEEYFPDLENYLEKHYAYPENITALGVTEPKKFRLRYPMVDAVVYDGKQFPFRDKSFDVCWSNAVLEHVGSFDDQALFLREIHRVSRQAFVTTPNRYFPIEVHTKIPFVHYLPVSIRDFVYKKLGKEWATDGYMRLLSRGDLKKLLHAAGVSSYSIRSNRIGPFAMDFVILFKDETRA
jgi:SAM-dependent methyltransferase